MEGEEWERESERERERGRERDQPPIGAAKLHDTPTAQAAASSSFECASFCKKKKEIKANAVNATHVHHVPIINLADI
jgi:hypothetical protein